MYSLRVTVDHTEASRHQEHHSFHRRFKVIYKADGRPASTMQTQSPKMQKLNTTLYIWKFIRMTLVTTFQQIFLPPLRPLSQFFSQDNLGHPSVPKINVNILQGLHGIVRQQPTPVSSPAWPGLLGQTWESLTPTAFPPSVQFLPTIPTSTVICLSSSTGETSCLSSDCNLFNSLQTKCNGSVLPSSKFIIAVI